MEIKAFLANPKQQNYASNNKNVFIVLNHRKNGDYHENPSLSHLMGKL